MNRRNLLKGMGLALGVAAGAAPAEARHVVRKNAAKIIRPARLKAGQTIGLIAPASNTDENEKTRFAMDVIRSFGFKVKAGKALYARTAYLAGTDEQRADDVNLMFADPAVDAIFCLRGGYGTPRILPLLDYDLIRQNPKIILGFSDITGLLLAIHRQTGLVTMHGPVAGQNFSDYTLAEFKKVLMAPSTPVRLGAPPAFDAREGRVERKNRITRFFGGTAKGRLVGGNLTLLTSLLGTPFAPDFKGKILFMEDVGEHPYRIDRMLTQLWLAGKLEEIAGAAFGKFTRSDGDTQNSFSIEEIIQSRFQPMGIPVIRGLMIGHIKDQTTVPIGAMAELDGDAGVLTLLEPGVV